jgi:hypothetical protein
VLLFQKRFHAGLVSGDVTLTFRRWDKPHVRVGGRYRCHPIGVLEVDRVDRVSVSSISERDAVKSGFSSRKELLEYIQQAKEAPLTSSTSLFRVELHHGGDGDRVEHALDTDLSADDVAAIETKLARMDANAEAPWTKTTLGLIAKHPRVAASKLAAKIGRETLPFKVDVRKLKKLGLTMSFEVGYDISPRGRAFLDARSKPSKRRESPRRGR